MEVLLSSTKETKDLAGKIAKKLNPGDTLALYGDLGSGKTTFVNFLVDALGIPARVQSPTFVLHRKYTGVEGNIKKSVGDYIFHNRKETFAECFRLYKANKLPKDLSLAEGIIKKHEEGFFK